MTRRLLLAIACVAVTHTAVAQDVRTLQLDRRLSAPATFKTEPCNARIVVENPDAATASPVSRDIFVVIDRRYRVYVGAVGTIDRGRYSLAFTPHDFLCDGKPHRVELSWNGARRTSYEVTFTRTQSMSPPFLVPPFDVMRPYRR